MKKIELKVIINCQKCKTQVMKAITKLERIDEVTIDAEKGIATVVGDVDPVNLTIHVKKATKFAELLTVGDPKKPEPKKPDQQQPCLVPLPLCCHQCETVVTYEVPYCTIL